MISKLNPLTKVIGIAAITTCIASTAFAQDNELNPTPSELFLERLDERTALISAKIPSQKPGGAVNVFLGKERAVLNDNGKQGDKKAGDGLFSIASEFDFDDFIKANQILAESSNKEKQALFAPGGRNQLGTREFFHEGEFLVIRDNKGEKNQQQFVLPLSRSAIRVGQTFALPTGGLSLGALSTGVAKTPASIPHSVMITDTPVVGDPGRTWSCPAGGASPVGNPNGEWTFWQLMENINNGTSTTSDYIKQFFKHWDAPQVVNGIVVADRPHVYQQIIEQWAIRSGGSPTSVLDPAESPFRLLAIALRLDLRGGTGSVYGGGDAGEGRFVFSLHDGDCNPMGKTLIMEYKVPIASCPNIRNWAQDWKALASSPSYNNDLANLTQVFSSAGANPSAPNQSAISQVRTNEFLPGSPIWQLREFVLPNSGGFLTQDTVKQEPDAPHNNTPLLADWINSNWPQLVGPPAAQHNVPLTHLGSNFLAGAAPAPLLWNAPSGALTVPTTPSPISPAPATIRDDALFQLGLNTCSGCHTVETGTPFAHISYNTPPGSPAILSGFLTGTTLPDPRNGAISRSFDDLARRANDLDDVAAMVCPTISRAPLGNLTLSALTAPKPILATH